MIITPAIVPSVGVSIATTGPETESYSGVYVPDPMGRIMLNACIVLPVVL